MGMTDTNSSYFPPTFEFRNWYSAWKRLLKWSHLSSRRVDLKYFDGKNYEKEEFKNSNVGGKYT